MALVLMNYAGYRKYDVTRFSDLEGYLDASMISPWALDAVKWANALKIINGSNQKINPAGDANRAEAAAMLVNFIERAK